MSFAKWDEDLFTHLYRHVDKEGVNLNDGIIEYREIDDYIFHKNPSMQNAWAVFETNKDINDTSDYYYDLADDLEGQGDDEATLAQNSARAQGYRISGDNVVDDSRTRYLSNIRDEKKIILDTKISFINYHKSIVSLKKAEAALESGRITYESAKLNYELGNMTKTDYLKAESEYKQAKASLDLAKSDVVTNKRNVLINCGYDMNDNIELGNIMHVSSEEVDARNDFSDKQVALENNLRYQIYGLQMENSHSDETKATTKINIDNAKSFISNDVDSKYNAMHDCHTAIYTGALAYKTAEDDYAFALASYEQGAISRKELNLAKVNVDVTRLDTELKYFDLDIAYENYMASIDGLAKASATDS